MKSIILLTLLHLLVLASSAYSAKIIAKKEGLGSGHIGSKQELGYSYDTFDPTVYPVPNFNALKDARLLRHAMKGIGTNEDVITEVLTKRSNQQRQAIRTAFKHEFGSDLVADLRDELSGYYRKVILALMETPMNYLAEEIHNATAKLGTDEDVLSEILCSLNSNDIAELNHAYNVRYGQSLEQVVEQDTSGKYKRLLTLLVNHVRDEHKVVPSRAREQAKELYKAGEGMLGTDEDTFIVMLTHESFDQLHYIMEEYRKISGKTLEQIVRSEFSGHLKQAILVIIKCAQTRAKFFAEELENAMHSTDDGTLIRIVVARSELDLGAIKEEYLNLYNRTLYSAVKSQISGDYRAAVLALIGKD